MSRNIRWQAVLLAYGGLDGVVEAFLGNSVMKMTPEDRATFVAQCKPGEVLIAKLLQQLIAKGTV